MRQAQALSKLSSDKANDKENMPAIAVTNNEKLPTPLARKNFFGAALEVSTTFDKRNTKSILPLAAPAKQSYNSQTLSSQYRT